MVKDWSPDLSLFIDTKAFEQAKVAIPSDKTALRYSDLADLAKQLTKRDGDKLVRMGWSYEAGWFVRTIQVILAQQSQRLYAPDFSAIALTSNPAAIEALRFFFDLSKEGVIWNPADPDPGLGGFVDGKSAITSYGYWFGNMIATASKSPVTDSAMMLPAPTWNGTRLSPSVVGTGAAIAQQSKHPDAAWKLYEYFMAGPPAEQRARTGWGVPGLKSLYPLLPQDTPFNKQRYTVLQSEVAFSDYVIDICPYYADDVFNQSWLNNLEPALKGTIGFDQLIQKIETDVNQAISAGRKRA
jgi:multiple sugar transport system substrate-binding protein